MSSKIDIARQLLEKEAVDVLLVTNPVNRYYLSDFDGSSGVLLISGETAYLVTDFRYTEQAEKQAKHFKIEKWQDDLYQSLVPLIEQAGWKKIGFESKHVVYSVYCEMKEKLPAELVPIKEPVENLRMIKNNTEIELLRRGGGILDRAFGYIQTLIKPDLTEKLLSVELEIFLLRQGAQKPAFNFIVASGERGAMPHGTASDKQIKNGDLLTIDFGAVFDNYATDMTRTLSIGEPNSRQCEIYNIVLEAQQAASAAVKPGLTGKEVDAVARDIIEKAGYGQYFGHGLGHGIGLETHEQPMLNHRSETVLEPGMVVTVEPGIYIPGWGGIRIEDMVWVTENGRELLTGSPRELIII